MVYKFHDDFFWCDLTCYYYQYALWYALSQIQFTGKNFIFVCVVLSIMVPGTALVIALFIFVAELRLINTWTGIILPQVISPVCVIVYKQFFDQVPKELREASLN